MAVAAAAATAARTSPAAGGRPNAGGGGSGGGVGYSTSVCLSVWLAFFYGVNGMADGTSDATPAIA